MPFEMLSQSESTLGLTIEVLEARIQSRTGYRLRNLTVEPRGEQIRIAASAPTYHVRQLAERAALELFPAEQLALAIDVTSRPTSFVAW